MEVFILWGFAALGVYHIYFRFNLLVRQRRAAANSLRDSGNQLRFVMNASFYKKKVMSKSEFRVFKAVEEQIQSSHSGYRVIAQTSLGEIIGSENKKAFDSINSKRVDILVVGPFGDPVAAVEYQGDGHYQGDAAARDAVKKEALRKAGVAYIEIFDTHPSDVIKQHIRDAVRQNS